ncbi:MAG: hypothetical protein LBE79_00445, partial [Tannerella sp.]|nr:hypothetical protein [Tannerella sp.]
MKSKLTIIVIGLLLALVSVKISAQTPVDITGKTVPDIKSAIESALNSGQDVTVTGSLTDAGMSLQIGTKAGTKVIWKAEIIKNSPSPTIEIIGDGTFEVADGGKIVSNYTATTQEATALRISSFFTPTVIISGGLVQATAMNVPAIHARYRATLYINSGEIRSAGIIINVEGYVKTIITGGTIASSRFNAIEVSAEGTVAVLGADANITVAMSGSNKYVNNSTQNAVIFVWEPTGSSPYTYNELDNSDLTIYGLVGNPTTAVWSKDGSNKNGIYYERGSNNGFIDVAGVTVTAVNDDAFITAAKAAIEGATYTDTQANVADIAAAKATVETIIGKITLNGVTATVVDGTFTAAIAGTAGTPAGTNGSYTFTVNLEKGTGTQQISSTLTLTITATPYHYYGSGISVNGGAALFTAADVQSAVNNAPNGTVTVTGELILPEVTNTIELNTAGKTIQWDAQLTGSA